MTEAAKEWKRSNEEAELMQKKLGDANCYCIHYEELCKNPSEIMKGIFNFLSLDENNYSDTFRNVDHHIIGNGMRLDAGEVALDERWKERLMKQELLKFNEVAGDLNKKLGYN